jgi:hypothetical protein
MDEEFIFYMNRALSPHHISLSINYSQISQNIFHLNFMELLSPVYVNINL